MSVDWDPAAADAEPNVELAQALRDSCLQRRLVEGSDQWRYLAETRGLPPPAIKYCSADLRELNAPIPGFDPLWRGVVTLLHDAAGEITGLAVEAVDIGGARALDKDGRTFRRTYALRKRGQIDALFRVEPPHDGALVGYVVEGRLAKPIAVAAILDSPAIYGWGGLHGLGCCLPPVPTVIVVEDAPPADPAKAAAHEQAMVRGCDRLVLGGKAVLRAGPPPGGFKDVDEALVGGVPLEELRVWLRSAEPYALSLDGHARRCAKIRDPLKRGEAIAEVAEQQQLRKRGLTKSFREQVDKYAGGRSGGDDDADGGGAQLQGDDPTPPEVVPWAQAVDGAALVAGIVTYLEDHVVLPPHGALTVTLWVLHAHTHDAAYHSPRLVLRSPTKGCGKSTLRRGVSRLVPRPFEAVDITGPTLFRPIGQWHPSVFIDEGNEIDWAVARDLVAVINSGHCRDDPGVPRCVGPDFEVRMFKVWAPLCLALIGHLPSPVTERSITIVMRKKLRTVAVRRMARRDQDAVADELARKAARWGLDHMIALENADPALPAALGDRPADNWRALLSIADIIGLGAAARAAAIALSTGLDDDDEDLGIQLLADLRLIFDAQQNKQLPSATLVGQLLLMEGRPWPEMPRTGRPLSTNVLARLLRPFKIHPSGTIRTGTSTPKGYARAAFEDAWKQYSLTGTRFNRHTATSQAIRRLQAIRNRHTIYTMWRMKSARTPRNPPLVAVWRMKWGCREKKIRRPISAHPLTGPRATAPTLPS